MKTLLVQLLLLVLCAPVAPAQDELSTPRVETAKLTDHIYRLTCIDRFSVNVVASIGPDGILLVDAGSPTTDARLQEALKELGGGELQFLINTHSHGDHTGGNATLAEEATIVAHKNTAERLSGSYYALEGLPADGQPNRVIEDSMSVDFNGEEVRIIHLPGGHTDGDLIVHFTGSGIVCMGDQFFAGMFPFVHVRLGGHTDRYLDNIERVFNIFPSGTRFIPGHGQYYNADEMRQYHEALVTTSNLIKDQYMSGKTAEETKATNLLAEWKAWDTSAITPTTTSDAWIDWVWGSLYSEETVARPSICEPLTQSMVEGGVAEAVRKYSELRESKPEAYEFGENELNVLGYELLARGRVTDAIEIFKLNIKAYPNSSNPYDSMGETFLIHGDTALAVENYRTSLQLDPENTNAVEQLERLGADPE
jgi:glyoxylase-like metal-dependent hydrolase (beta-lactamase superfamily II)